MKTQTAIAVITAALLSGAGAAAAASMQPMTQPKPSDSLSLSSAQQKVAWNDLDHATDQNAPAGFSATTGVKVPTTIKISAVPAKASRDVSSLRPYDFAKVGSKILIVNPSDRMVAEVLSG